MLYRHAYLLLGSWPRLLDLIYWPTVQMILWGFITQFLVGQSGWVAQAAGVFLSAVLLWDTLFRGQLGVSMCFLEEMYARHLGHLFVSPLRPGELVIANFLVSLMRVLIGVGGAAILAIPIFHFSIIGTLGWAIIPFFAVMMLFGWAIGLIIAGLVIRLGLGAESLAWAAIFFIQPFSAVYYPIDDPAGRGALDRLPAALRAGVRGHAGGAGRAPLRLGAVRPGRGRAGWSGWWSAASPSRCCSTARAGAGCCCRRASDRAGGRRPSPGQPILTQGCRLATARPARAAASGCRRGFPHTSSSGTPSTSQMASGARGSGSFRDGIELAGSTAGRASEASSLAGAGALPGSFSCTFSGSSVHAAPTAQCQLLERLISRLLGLVAAHGVAA